MPNLLIRNLPEELHQELRRAAELHRRSVNQETIATLEAGLGAVGLARTRLLEPLVGTRIVTTSETLRYIPRGPALTTTAMIIVDTNILIPLLVVHEDGDKARMLFERDGDWHMPDWWQIELANVLRNYHRAGIFSLEQTREIQRRAEGLVPPANTHSVDLGATLELACNADISAYDARFIALAHSFGQRLVTQDSRLRKACPDDTCSLDQALVHMQ